MPITKRTRYEVLRRDNHTCRYCGDTAPAVKLTVDHVTPVSLGGSDKPGNLVAACRDCNAGKASTSPSDAMVADVRADALRHAELTRQAYGVLIQRMGERDDYIEEWRDRWTHVGLPTDWRNTVGRWFEMGVPVELIADAADIACSKSTLQDSGRFSYMCGIVWSQVRMVDELAEARRYIEGAFLSGEALTNERIDAYESGRHSGANAILQVHARMDPLSQVVDRIDYPTLSWGVPV